MKHNLLLPLILLLSFSAHAQLNDGDPLPGDGNEPIETEEPVPEVIENDELKYPPIPETSKSFDENLPGKSNWVPQKRPIPQFHAETCLKIRANRAKFPVEKISRATQYFTPMFEPGANGRLQKKDRRVCINMEGSCVVDAFLYNYAGKGKPWGKMYERAVVPFKFGKGNGASYYNKTNALDPCRTLAADTKVYPVGTVIYVPSMLGKICPQTGKEVDGCFIVGDVGSAIKGQGRFDFFTGECARYNKKNHTCDDEGNRQFIPKSGDPFYVIGRHNMMAKTLREEADLFIENGWSREIFPIPPGQ